MAFSDEMASHLIAQSICTALGTDIFISKKARIPPGAGPYVQLTETGGTAPRNTHDRVGATAYQRPGMQVLVTAASESDARSKAAAAHSTLSEIRNLTIGTARYLYVTAQQEPFELPLDGQGRARWAFNIDAMKTHS